MVNQISTLKEVATYIMFAEKTVYRLASEGEFPRFKREDIDAWIDSKKVKV